MLYKRGTKFTGQGHTGFVTTWDAKQQLFNSLEGNAGNRVKQGLRSKGEETLIGFINLFGDRPRFKQGIVSGEKLEGGNTR